MQLNRWRRGPFGDELPGSLEAFAVALRSGVLSAREVAETSLDAVERSQADINAFIRIEREAAIASAGAVDRQLRAGNDPGPLAGVPVAIKDVFDFAGLPTTAGSRAFAGNVATRDAVAVARLRAAGAIVVGKANMDQFAFGPHQDDYGRTNCPADLSRYAGGSSGGSAAAVAAGVVLAALGSDAGGSTRFPAACCGVAGYKGTFGRIPTDGLFPTFPTLDHVAVVARSAGDVVILDRVLAADEQEPFLADGTLRLAVLADWRQDSAGEVAAVVDEALERLVSAGAALFDAELPGYERCLPTLLATVGPEAAVAFESIRTQAEPALPAPLAELLEAGRREPATDYVAAQAVRAELRQELDVILDGVDALVTPTSPELPWRWDEIDAGDMGLRNRATLHLPLANLTGHPAISLPLPTPSLPVGLQLIGPRGRDPELLATAMLVEQTLWQ